MRHREYRYPCTMPATLDSSAGRHRVMIVNVSANGMRIGNTRDEPAIAAFTPGQRVTLHTLDLMLDAEIRWSRGGFCGLRLEQTLAAKALARIRQLRGPVGAGRTPESGRRRGASSGPHVAGWMRRGTASRV